jgi:hypothetical protein
MRPVNGPSTVPSASWPRVRRYGGHPTGTVPIWKQWTIIAAGVLVSPVIVLGLAG